MVQIDDNPEDHRYEALVDGKLAGFIDYQLRGDRITIYHTEVYPAYEGQGIGGELAKAALGDVVERGLELVPLCSFIANYVRRHPQEYLGSVVESMREQVAAGQ